MADTANNTPSAEDIGKSKIYVHPSLLTEDEFVRDITRATFTREKSAVAGPVMYLNGGDKLYSEFIRASSNGDPRKTKVAQSIKTEEKKIVEAAGDSERFVIVGTGTGDIFEAQELKIIEAVRRKQDRKKSSPGPKLTEIVLIDVSIESLKEAMEKIDQLAIKKGITDMKVVPICARFEDVAGAHFDNILADQGEHGLRSREDIKATVISMGGTFGNIEDSQLVGFPTNAVDTRLATFGELVGQGSTVIIDHYTSLNEGNDNYRSAEADRFLQNGLQTMAESCVPGDRIKTDQDADNKMFALEIEIRRAARAVIHNVRAKSEHEASVKNGSGPIALTIDSSPYSLMVSLRPKPYQISGRPTVNTGLETEKVMENDKHAMHIFTKVSTPGILLSSNTASHTRRAEDTPNHAEPVQGMRRSLQPFIAGRGLSAAPA